MCGRVNVSDLDGLDELIASIVERTELRQTSRSNPRRDPRWNVAPTSQLDAVTSDSSVRRMRWGIESSWTQRSGSAARPLINARSESVFEKPSFREHARTRRCVVPINGFYEWRRSAKQREAFYISAAAQPGLLVAAIWADAPLGEGAGESALPSVCLLTRAATAAFADIHDRMPVMLTPQTASLWMGAFEICHSAIDKAPMVPLNLLAVGDYVNNARNEGPECVAPTYSPQLF